jgi:hypothetical protein
MGIKLFWQAVQIFFNESKYNKNFWKELIAYFPFATY